MDTRYPTGQIPLWRIEKTIKAKNNRATFFSTKLNSETYSDADEYRFETFDYMPPENMVGRDHKMGYEPLEFEWPEEKEKYFVGKLK
jgi:hypothetical protein